MIELRPFDDLASMAVFNRLDINDQMEAEATRGAACNHLALWAEWRAMQPAAVASVVALNRGQAFAVFMLVNTGQAGVAAAALLARDHARHRRPLAQLAATLRRNMSGYCADRGIHRIEARAWADHPTASQLLGTLGFAHETDMRGFGPRGRAVFRQFAWVAPSLAPQTTPKTGETPCVL